MEEKAISLEETQKLHSFLQGDNQEENLYFDKGNVPNLTPDQAFAVIYYLQEAKGLRGKVISDYYEKCSVCNEIYDTLSEGYTNQATGDHYCYTCDSLT